MLTERQKETIEKAVRCDDLQWRIDGLKKLALQLQAAEKTYSVHSDDWDQGFMEAKHMIAIWILRQCGENV